jgi:2-methylcitrate dehydratase
MPTKIVVTKKDGSTLSIEKSDYEGFFTRPMSWQQVEKKFLSFSNRREIIELCKNLENIDVSLLTEALRKVQP